MSPRSTIIIIIISAGRYMSEIDWTSKWVPTHTVIVCENRSTICRLCSYNTSLVTVCIADDVCRMPVACDELMDVHFYI